MRQIAALSGRDYVTSTSPSAGPSIPRRPCRNPVETDRSRWRFKVRCGPLRPENLATRPSGALGQVASPHRSVGGDIVAIDILDRAEGRAVDEFVVELGDGDLVDLLVTEIHEVDGVSVDDVSRPRSRWRTQRTECERTPGLGSGVWGQGGPSRGRDRPPATNRRRGGRRSRGRFSGCVPRRASTTRRDLEEDPHTPVAKPARVAAPRAVDSTDRGRTTAVRTWSAWSWSSTPLPPRRRRPAAGPPAPKPWSWRRPMSRTCRPWPRRGPGDLGPPGPAGEPGDCPAGAGVPPRAAEPGERRTMATPPLSGTDSAGVPCPRSARVIPRPVAQHWIAAPETNVEPRGRKPRRPFGATRARPGPRRWWRAGPSGASGQVAPALTRTKLPVP